MPGRALMAANFSSRLQPRLVDNRHTIFGEVVEGQDVADKISKLPRDAGDPHTRDFAACTHRASLDRISRAQRTATLSIGNGNGLYAGGGIAPMGCAHESLSFRRSKTPWLVLAAILVFWGCVLWRRSCLAVRGTRLATWIGSLRSSLSD